MIRRTRALALLSLTVFAGAAHAGSLGVANSFNAFVFGNANTQGGHSEGAVAVGGNWGGTSYEAKQRPASQVPYGNVNRNGFTNIGVYLGGNNTLSQNPNLRVIQGNAYHGGTAGVMDVQNGFQRVNQMDMTVFSQQLAHSNQQSSWLNSLAQSQGTALNTSGQNLSVNATGPLAIYRVNASALNDLKTLQVNAAAGTTVVFNVEGTGSANWKWSVNSNAKNRILWNVRNLSTLNVLERDLDGSLLAPGTVINQYRNIRGTMIAKDWNVFNSTELHFDSGVRFTGEAPVPEPGTLVALGAGALALLRRRRKA